MTELVNDIFNRELYVVLDMTEDELNEKVFDKSEKYEIFVSVHYRDEPPEYKLLYSGEVLIKRDLLTLLILNDLQVLTSVLELESNNTHTLSYELKMKDESTKNKLIYELNNLKFSHVSSTETETGYVVNVGPYIIPIPDEFYEPISILDNAFIHVILEKDGHSCGKVKILEYGDALGDMTNTMGITFDENIDRDFAKLIRLIYMIMYNQVYAYLIALSETRRGTDDVYYEIWLDSDEFLSSPVSYSISYKNMMNKNSDVTIFGELLIILRAMYEIVEEHEIWKKN
jgi:hypothetical protein